MSAASSVSQSLQRRSERRYRSTRVESSVSQTRQASFHSAQITTGMKASMHSKKGEEEVMLSPLPKTVRPICLAVDKDTEIIGYVVPAFRTSHAFARAETQEESVGHIAMRSLFSRQTETVEVERVEKKTREMTMRESAESITLKRKLLEREEFQRKMNADSLTHHPEFMVKPKSYTVWENQSVTLHCTVAGWPKPLVTWYKNNVVIDAKAHSEKYTVESNYNMHSLQIKSCTFEDTAEYSVSALNIKGGSTSVSTVVVKRFNEEELLHPERPHGFCAEYGVTFESHIVDKFAVSFGREGETMSLGCTVIVYPTVKRYKPDVLWFRNDVQLKPSKWVSMNWSGDKATLTLIHLNKEDEGLYTMRINTKSGYNSYSAYVFVRDAAVEVEGAPVAPLDVRCQDANKDYVVVTWRQPAVEGASPILGYFVDRCEVGTTHWVQCNDTPVKFARFPVTGLVEGRSYSFRVRAINKFGISWPSRASEPVAAMDPSVRLRGHPSAPWTGQIIVTEEEPAAGVVPGQPSDLAVTEATKSYVVLSWKPPGQRGHEGIMYYVEKCISGTDTWQRVNTEMPVRSPRFALFDLAEGKTYSFRVRCVNSAGVGEPSDPTGEITVGDKLDLPQAPSNVVVVRLTDTSMVVIWKASQEATQEVRYYIEYSVVGSNVWHPCNNKPVKGTRFICHGLHTGDTCVFRVKAVNSAGYSQSSQESESILVKAAIAIPSPPRNVTLLERVKDYMVLGWDEPKLNGGVEISGYYLDYRTVKDGVAGQWHELNTKAVKERTYKAENLKENVFYQFQVRAVNEAGLSKRSVHSSSIECKEYTITVPGLPHSLHVQEVRKDSLVLLWEPPVYQGRTKVNGFYVDIKEAAAPEEAWRGVNEKATSKKYIKVKGLKEGVSYVLRVCAQNLAGVGKAAELPSAVLAQTRPGTHEIIVDVDDDGVISMIFECSEMSAESQFVWSKNYVEAIDASRLKIETVGGKSRAIFTDPSVDDLGIYSCVVTHTDGVSSSYTLTEEGLKRLLEISHDHKFPIIPFKSELAVELLEKGRVRFWMQAEKITSNCEVEYVFNDNIITQGEKYTMNFDKSTGIIELFMDSLEVTDEGTFTFSLVDGKATGCTSLVLIGDEFRELQKKSEFERHEWFRKQGPHFVEYLTFEVTPACNVLLKARVGNLSAETDITWYKDGLEVDDEEKLDFTDGVLTLNIAKISRKDAGLYEVQLKDSRGKDKSQLDLTDKGFQAVMNEVFRVIANSATELSILSTEHGIVLHTSIVYYTEELRVGWLQKESKISQSDHLQFGVTGEELWLKINAPTEKDKGKYAIDIFDGASGVKRIFDLSGQAWEEAYAEYQRLKAAAHAERNRARVIGGLPDVVTIQEGKSLNLTGNIWGDPVPEVSWMKNERTMESDDRYTLKFEAGKYASITITSVTPADSGKYSLVVKNKYGEETGNFTVSVYIPEGEEEAPEDEKK
ncbi:myomesin 1a (skelemin) [Megalops cyprinoides]|uniref:myomesin 1a (skelemin) n=1 Tax=Megalops cyprinoides TaxID=118141 RepID=UPI001865225B|nr:myomesin 1a (skelemin) [Megalops cyprinoides]